MNTENYQTLEDLLTAEITRVERKLKGYYNYKELRLSWGHAEQIAHDLTITRLSARLELLNETLGQLIDWSNN